MLKQIQWQMLELNLKHRKIFDKYAKYKYFEIIKYKLKIQDILKSFI